MNIEDTPKLRPVVWMGNTRKNIMAFPEKIRKLIGDELQLIQFGGMPKDAKAFKGVGSGVIEIALKYNKEAYRCVGPYSWEREFIFSMLFRKKQRKGFQPQSMT